MYDDELKTAWERISNGLTLGKRGVVQKKGPAQSVGGIFTDGSVDLFTLKSPRGDYDALQLSVTIAPPKFFQVGTGLPGSGNMQDLAGSLDNIQQVNIPAAIQVAVANPVVTLQWGIGGVDCEATIDCLNGLAVNITTSFLRAKMAIEETDGTANIFYELSAFVGPGYPKPWNAQRTVFFSTGGGSAESTVVATPKFAKSVLLVGDNATDDPFVGSIQFYRNPAGNDQVGARYYFTGTNPRSVPVPNGGYYFTISSFIQSSTCNAIFELAI